jgi:hypothetical protein
VIETSTTGLVAQACVLEVAPPFGSLVRVEAPPGRIYGLVAEIRTGGLEPGSQAIMRGRAGVRDAAIFRENPDLSSVLRTEFRALLVGFREQGLIRQYLPSQPPPLHWSVYACDPLESAAFAEQLDYFRTVLAANDAPADELVAANLRQMRLARSFDSSFATRAGRELARLLKRDYDRLSAILRRFQD